MGDVVFFRHAIRISLLFYQYTKQIYSELSGGHVVDTINKFLRNRTIILKSYRFRKNMMLDLSQLERILTWCKNTPPIVRRYSSRGMFIVFSMTSMTLSLETANGDRIPPPPWTVENGGVTVAH